MWVVGAKTVPQGLRTVVPQLINVIAKRAD
jgi:hypothetical protein